MVCIREMCPEDYDQKAYVHWKTWRETYTGLMEESYLSSLTLEKCQTLVRRWPQNTLVAELDGKIVGFSCYGHTENGEGEVIAIYLLKEVQGTGLGWKLMNATVAQLTENPTIGLWVLKGNNQAIGFYEHYGFHLSGKEKTGSVGTELWMVYTR